MVLGMFRPRVEVETLHHYLKSGNHVYLGGFWRVREKLKILPRSHEAGRGLFMRMSAGEWSSDLSPSHPAVVTVLASS